MKKILIIMILLIFTKLTAQWNEEWSSTITSIENNSGWIYIHSISNQNYNFYIVDGESFRIMQSPNSESPLYIYYFTSEEIAAGNQIYSTGIDLSGDDIFEFYVLAYNDNEENPRQSFKLLDITTGSILFEKDEAGSSFSYPVIWDVDNDNELECTFAEYDYPAYSFYSYTIVNTGVATSLSSINENLNNFELMQNYPNPFNPATTIDFINKNAGRVNLKVYNTNGQLVKTLVDGYINSGMHKIEWDGTNSSGIKVSSGPYYYQLIDGKRINTKKMMIIK
jgi:hypothetical protein